MLDEILQAERKAHVSIEEQEKDNKRSGLRKKTVKTSTSVLSITTLQDRHSTFDPATIKKRETMLAHQLENKIIGLYALGMSYKAMGHHIHEIYDNRISTYTLQQITDRSIPEVKISQHQPLKTTYTPYFGSMPCTLQSKQLDK